MNDFKSRNCLRIWKIIFLVFIMISTFTILIANINAIPFQMEWGNITTSNENWIQINLTNNYINPVVVATPEYTSTSQDYGISTWITNVSSNSFLLRTSNEHFNNTDNIKVHYIVMENGSWIISENNIKVEAGIHITKKVGSQSTGWDCPNYGDIINFSFTFNDYPILISTRGSNNNPNSWATTFQHDPSSNAGTVSKTQMCQGLSQSKATSPGTISNNEIIYWIAIDQGNGHLNGIEFETLWNLKDTGDSGGSWINGYKDGIPFKQSWVHTWLNSPNIILASETSVAGSDGGWPIIYDTGDKNQIRMFIDEANERSHSGSESGGGWAFSKAGNFGIHSPNNIFINFTKNFIYKNQINQINATITDFEGNNTIKSVISTIISPNSTKYNISLNPEIINENLTSNDVESSVSNYTAITDGEIIGEVGNISLYNRTSKIITFKNTYNETPIIIATVSSDNNDDSPFIPTFYSINKTSANITLCRDNGQTTCDNNYLAENVNYIIIDINKTNKYSWIEVGKVNAPTDGSSTSISFNKTFANTPYVFSSAQTYNINSVVQNGISGTSWISGISTTGANLIGCDHPGTGNSCAGTSTETYGYLAIDLNNENLKDFTSGTKGISNSDWTNINFGRNYNKPRVFVTVDSDNGNQDPKYPWAKSITTSGGDIRYCEADGANYCDTHISEDTMWFVVENGSFAVGNGGDDIEKNTTIKTYYNVFNETTHNITEIILRINITKYNNSGSISRGNKNPDLNVEFYDKNYNWIDVGNLNISSNGLFLLNISNKSILNSWSQKYIRNIKINGINFDYFSSTKIDEIDWNLLNLEVKYKTYTSKWFGNFSNTVICGNYSLTDLFSKDEDNLTNHTTYSNIKFNIPCGPIVKLLYPINKTKLITNKTINFKFYIGSSDNNLSCKLYINSILNKSFICDSNQNNSINLSLDRGYYNWTINATDSYNISTIPEEEFFYNILNYSKRISKSIININSNLYKVNINLSNKASYNDSLEIIDYIHENFNSGSFSKTYNWSKNIYGMDYFGKILGWNLLINNNSTMEINYSITNNKIDYNLLNEFMIGLK